LSVSASGIPGIDDEHAIPGELEDWLQDRRRVEAWPDRVKRDLYVLRRRVYHLEVCVHRLLNEKVREKGQGQLDQESALLVIDVAQHLLNEAPVDAMLSLATDDCREADEIKTWVGRVQVWQEAARDPE